MLPKLVYLENQLEVLVKNTDSRDFGVGSRHCDINNILGGRTWLWYPKASPLPMVPLSFCSRMSGSVHRPVLLPSSHSTSPLTSLILPHNPLCPPLCLWDCWLLRSSSLWDSPGPHVAGHSVQGFFLMTQISPLNSFFYRPLANPLYSSFIAFTTPHFLSFRFLRAIEMTKHSIAVCSIVMNTEL